MKATFTVAAAFAALASIASVAGCDESALPKQGSPRREVVDREFGRRRGAAEPSNASATGAASFGLYVLSLGWTASFCCGHPDKGECKISSNDFAATHLTLHGLWPNYTDAESAAHRTAYPVFCGEFAQCSKGSHPPALCTPSAASIPVEMSTLGPGYVTDHDFLADHEWPKHGGCTGLDAAAYFEAAIDAMKKLPGSDGTPDLLKQKIGGDVATKDLAAAFGEPDSVLLSCDASCALEQIGVCLAHDAHGVPTTRVACPTNTTKAEYDNGCVTRGCAAVHIPIFGACDAHGGAHAATTAGGHGHAACDHPGQGPSCTGDAACTSQGYARCAKSGCCTSVAR